MSQLIPFESSQLPAYLKQAAADINADITAHSGGGFPVISIKGKQFAIVRDGERKILPNPKDPDSPATSVDVVILKVSPIKSKVFYLKGYDPKESEGKKPDCWSHDGTKPDASAEAPQSKLCATCPQNQWGAKVSDAGKKMKACQDTVRLAVATADAINDPYLLRVPPASIRPLGEFGQQLAKRNIPYNAVVAKIGFDPEAESPKLTFKPVALLPEPIYNEVQEVVKGDTVQQILGTISPAEALAEAPTAAEQVIAKAAAPTKAKTVTTEEVANAVKAAEAAPPKAPAKPKAEEIDVDLSLDDVSFDD